MDYWIHRNIIYPLIIIHDPIKMCSIWKFTIINIKPHEIIAKFDFMKKNETGSVIQCTIISLNEVPNTRQQKCVTQCYGK